MRLCEGAGTIQRHINSLPSSKSIFFQPFKQSCISEVVRIGSIIIFYLSKLWKAKFFILYDAILQVWLQKKFEIDHSLEWKGWHTTTQSSAPCEVRSIVPCAREFIASLEEGQNLDSC